MTRQIHIESEQEVGRITDLIHDQYLDIEGLEFDKEHSSLTLRYFIAKGEFFVRLEFPTRECFLTIFNVASYTLRDTQQIRYYPMNKLLFVRSRNVVEVKTGIPLELSVSVTRFAISVEETDKIVDEPPPLCEA